jgi:hypothetical protein
LLVVLRGAGVSVEVAARHKIGVLRLSARLEEGLHLLRASNTPRLATDPTLRKTEMRIQRRF